MAQIKKSFSKQKVIVIAITSLVLLLLFVSSQFAKASFQGNIFPSATPTDRLASEIEDVYRSLSNPNIDPQLRSGLEKRLYAMQREQTKVVIIRQITPHLPPGRGPNYTPEPIGDLPLSGIIDGPFMLPGQKDVVIENAWQDKVDGTYVVINAGFRRHTPNDQGVVCYETVATPIVCMDVPQASGSVHVAERKDIGKAIKLVLKSKKGEDFFFDVRGRRFTKSLDEVVPTITPVPTGENTALTPTNAPVLGYPAPGTPSPTALNHCDQEKAWNDARPLHSKSDMSEEQYQQCIAALTQAPKIRVLKPEETPPPTRIPKETRPRRIAGHGILIEGLLGMRNPSVFVQTNAWYEKSGDRFIYVFGGITRKDPSPDRSHSAVAVRVSDLAGNWLAEDKIYEAPIQAGELTILDARGALLTLSTPDGRILLFDVPSRKFITPDANTLAASKQRQTGNGMLVEKRGSPFDGSYIVTNQWYHEDNGKRLSIFAGRTKEKNGQAVVLVTTSQGEPTNATPVDAYSLPGYVASEWNYLRIFQVDQDKVTLVGKRGGKYVFDLSTRKFLTQFEGDQLPNDPDLLALEASYAQVRSEAALKATFTVTTSTPTPTPTLPAYP